MVDILGFSWIYEGSVGKLVLICEVGCFVVVVGVYSGVDFKEDLELFMEDLLIVDFEIVNLCVEKFCDLVKKLWFNWDKEIVEFEVLELIFVEFEKGKVLVDLEFFVE